MERLCASRSFLIKRIVDYNYSLNSKRPAITSTCIIDYIIRGTVNAKCLMYKLTRVAKRYLYPYLFIPTSRI